MSDRRIEAKIVVADTSRLREAFDRMQKSMAAMLTTQRRMGAWLSWRNQQRWRWRAAIRLAGWWWRHGGSEDVLNRSFCLVTGHRPHFEFDVCMDCGLSRMTLVSVGDEWTPDDLRAMCKDEPHFEALKPGGVWFPPPPPWSL